MFSNGNSFCWGDCSHAVTGPGGLALGLPVAAAWLFPVLVWRGR